MALKGLAIPVILALQFFLASAVRRMMTKGNTPAQESGIELTEYRSTASREKKSEDAVVPYADVLDAEHSRWTVMIYWARHGQSCANAMEDLGPLAKIHKNLFNDPVLTDCGVHRSQQAGEKFAKWAWAGASIGENGTVKVDPEKLEQAHNGDDLHLGLDMIGSSTLFRAMETALYEFGRLSSFSTFGRIFPLPYISEHGIRGITRDNNATTQEVQQMTWEALTKTAPKGPAMPVGTMNNGREMDGWSAFEADYSYVSNPHKIGGDVRPAGTGSGESDINAFYSFLAENVLPALAATRVSSKLDELRTIRLGIASHSNFLKSVFMEVCGMEGKPLNNDVLAVPFDFVFSADGLHTLTPKHTGRGSLKEFCGAGSSPVSQKNDNLGRKLSSIPKKLCASEAARCQKQIDMQQMKGFPGGTRLGQSPQCMCTD